jgi:hypothetical protein
MLPNEAFDRADRRVGKVIGMDTDERGRPKNYVILLEGETAEDVLGAGAHRGLLVIPAADAFVATRNATGPMGTAAAGAGADKDGWGNASADADRILVLKTNLEKIERTRRAAASPADEMDPAAW